MTLNRHTSFLPFLAATLCLLLSACASINPFAMPYPQRADLWKQEISQGQGQQALNWLDQQQGDHNRLLYSLEAGRIAQVMRDYPASQKWFAQAASIYDQEDEAARIRVSSLSQDAASLVTNDRVIRYRGEPYERIFSETFQALNYLAQGDAAGAAVEFRRVDHTQRQQELDHQGQIARAEEKNDDRGNIDTSKYEGYFQGLNGAAALVRSGIENAYSYYLTAVFWEGRGDYNDALVDYKQALQILPQADFIKADIQRVSQELDGRVSQKQGLLVVALEQGFVPPKQPVAIPIPTTQGVVMVNFPTYQLDSLTHPVPLRIRVGNDYATTEPLARVGAIAAHALKERIPGILTRQILRTTAKYALQKEANKNLGLLGAFATQLYNIVSEQADLRSWLTLPANAQVARMPLPAGTQTVELSLPTGNTEVMATIPAAGVCLVRVIQAGGKLTTQVMTINPDGG
jgi:hypothetical protein